jgi:hypothetical protein
MKGLILVTAGERCFGQAWYSSDKNADIGWAEKYPKQTITII